ncbi:MAG: ribonucrease [Patescibacteria group bacterium]|jgi:ribonuclease Y|nr:ribonucrease [Patescibacteria group bacterium]
MNQILLATGMLLAGGIIGYSIRAVIFILRKNNLELSVSERLMHAKEQAQKLVDEAQEKIENVWNEFRTTEKQKEQDYKNTEDRLIKKESLLDLRQQELDSRAKTIEQKLLSAEALSVQAQSLVEERISALEELSNFSQEDARNALIIDTQKKYEEDFAVRINKLENTLTDSLKDRAKEILTTAIQRLAVPTTNALTTASVAIPNDEIKGKIIGKEGRNIRTFERASGVELLIDESPGFIVVSCFDPVRRAIATNALEALIKDGRIQPARIEEELENSKNTIHEIMKERGAAAVYECGIFNLDPRVVAVLGRLHYRSSYGQNVLQHSIEMAHVAGILATELGADAYIAKAGALVHDIGKALDHEFEGTHVEIGVKMLRRFGTDERIISAMKSHHDDCPHESLEAVIVQTADMISGSRAGARRDSAEMYLKRLAELESLASSFDGVEKAYVLQAGREIRIFVHPQAISDMEAKNLARNIAVNIERDIRYPGQIKVTIIRETRVIDYAR